MGSQGANTTYNSSQTTKNFFKICILYFLRIEIEAFANYAPY